MKRFAGLAAATGMVVALIAAPAFGDSKYFKAKPSGVKCVAKAIDKPSAKLRCDIPGERGKAVFLNRTDKGHVGNTSSPLRLRNQSLLGAGETKSFGPFTCTSAEALACHSQANHGFNVGKGSLLLF